MKTVRAIYDACGRRIEWAPQAWAPYNLPPVTHRIIYNRKNDGGVSVCEPSARALWHLQNGGRWPHAPRGWLQEQIDRQIADNIPASVARTFVNGMMWGGMTEFDAWTTIVQRDCERHGNVIDIIAADDLPDRWFRDAWYRSPNGGPIGIDLPKARVIQWQKIERAAERAKRKRLPRLTLQRAIANARDEHELRKVWLDGLERAVA